MQVHRRTRPAGTWLAGHLAPTVGLVPLLVVVLAVVLGGPGLATAQESPTPQPRTAIGQSTTEPGPSAPPMDPTVPATIDPTIPSESPSPTGTGTVIPSPDPSATLPPTLTPTQPPATETPLPTVPAPIAPTVPPVAPVPTDPPVDQAPAGLEAPLPDAHDGIAPAMVPISLSDRFDDSATRLLGETSASDERITGRYEGGRYRLEIDGPEVAPDLIAVVRSPDLIDATIQVTAQLEGTTQDRYVMATCREVEGYGGYRAYLSPGDGYFAITRFEPGAYPMELQRGFAEELVQGNDPFAFAFSCVGFVLELRVNGETIGIAADNAFASGMVSIGTGYFSNAEPGPVTAMFEDLAVTGSASAATAADGQRQANLPGGPIQPDPTPPAARRERPAD